MDFGDYYDPSNKVVRDGDVIYATDLNKVNSAVDVALESVALDLAALEAELTSGAGLAEQWASSPQGTRPNPLTNAYSSYAYALEAKDWATASGLITEASTGLPLAGSVSAKTYASNASASASAASGSASTASSYASTATTQANNASSSASTATTQAGIATTQAGIATTQAGIATTAASSIPTPANIGGNKALITNASGSAWTSSAITTAGLSMLSATDAAAQKTLLSLNNVPNINCTNISNVASGTLNASYIDSAIARLASPTFTGTVSGITKSMVGLGNVDNTSDINKPISTATQTALDSKASITSTTGAVVIPSGTSAQRPANAIQIRYNSDLAAFEGCNGSTWGSLATNTSGVTTFNTRSGAVTLTGTDVTNALGYTPAPTNNPTFTGSVTLPNTTYSISISGSSNSCLGNANTASSATYATTAGSASTSSTQAVDNNTSNIATTAFVLGQKGSSTPLVNGSASAGSSYRYASQDHIHPHDTGLIPSLSSIYVRSSYSLAATSGSITIDWNTNGNYQVQPEPTGSISYTFTSPSGPCHLQLLIDSDGTSTAQTITWPGNVIWMGVTWSSIANKKAIINFFYDGTNYYAMGVNQV